MPYVRPAILICLLMLTGCGVAHPTTPTEPATAPTATGAARHPATNHSTTSPDTAAHLPSLLLHLPGVGGTRTLDTAMVHGFLQAGFHGDVQIYDWTGGDEGLHALRNTPRNRAQARLIAEVILTHWKKDPTARIYLTSHSGGAGLAVWALEDLPPSVQVQDLLLMSSALSPTYDLTAALRHVAGHAYAFTSLSDEFVLGLGTRVFGTIDGIQTDAAGRVGFTRPAAGDPVQYAKLVQFPYQPAWIQYGDRGDHLGGMTRRFARYVLAPLLLSGTMPTVPPLLPVTRPTASTTLPVGGAAR